MKGDDWADTVLPPNSGGNDAGGAAGSGSSAVGNDRVEEEQPAPGEDGDLEPEEEENDVDEDEVDDEEEVEEEEEAEELEDEDFVEDDDDLGGEGGSGSLYLESLAEDAMISLEFYMAAGFTREEAFQLILADRNQLSIAMSNLTNVMKGAGGSTHSARGSR